ncbi:MAG: hypothetical protein LBI74_00910 [Synergistaceae bacterium]|jgi:hypothetical protein|nr:hypothetical protein [Synergistaceae bacterium]
MKLKLNSKLVISSKDVINENADDAISFFMPGLAAERDYSKKPESADPVHETIGGDSDKGSRISDVCLSVPLITGYAPRAGWMTRRRGRLKNLRTKYCGNAEMISILR